MTNRVASKSRAGRSLVLLMLVAGLFSACGYTEKQMEEARRRAHYEGISEERERCQLEIKRLETENQAQKAENQNLRAQLEQVKAEAEKARADALFYGAWFYTVGGFGALSFLALSIFAARSFLARRGRQTSDSRVNDWTAPPPSVTAAG